MLARLFNLIIIDLHLRNLQPHHHHLMVIGLFFLIMAIVLNLIMAIFVARNLMGGR